MNGGVVTGDGPCEASCRSCSGSSRFPGITLAALVLLFGAYAFVDGIFLTVWAIANHRIRGGRPW